MKTLTAESFLLSETGDSLYPFDITTVMLKDALSANCVGNVEKCHSLIQLIIELHLYNVLNDLQDCEGWDWPEIDRGEAAYCTYEKRAVVTLTEQVLDCEFLTPDEVGKHMGNIHRFLGGLPGLAYKRIKREVAATKLVLAPPNPPRPNDIA